MAAMPGLNSRCYCGKMHAPKKAFWSMIAIRKAVSADFHEAMGDRFRIATAIAIELQDANDEAIAIEVRSGVNQN
jgi:hypothetical protein